MTIGPPALSETTCALNSAAQLLWRLERETLVRAPYSQLTSSRQLSSDLFTN